jgi:hypothetical protein
MWGASKDFEFYQKFLKPPHCAVTISIRIDQIGDLDRIDPKKS